MLIRSLASDAVADVDDDVAQEMLKKGWVPAGSAPKKQHHPVAGAVEHADDVPAPRKRAAKKVV
jgi:hypothetical protein